MAIDKSGDTPADNQTIPIYGAGEKRWEIVKAAAGLFIRQGYLNTGVREIAEASGITVGTLYHYFKSKDEILAAFQDGAVANTENFIKQSEPMFTKMSPQDALRKAIELYVGFTDEAQSIVLFWHQETKNLKPDERRKLMENEMVLADFFEKLIVRGQKEGVFKFKDARLAAHTIIVLGDMWAFRRWWLGKRFTSAQYARMQTEFILQGLCNGKLELPGGQPGEVRKKT